MGAAEVAVHLGVSRQRVHEIRRTHSEFPEPVDVLSCGPIWLADEVISFAESWRRVPGPVPRAV